ncbi:MAG: YncE family protein, partial [Proteobacteria bacterium]|nr:YncE family protein [Pseudomonadota bacterium]
MKIILLLGVLFLLTNHQIVIAGDNSLLLAVNKNSDYLSVLDLGKGLEIKKIPTGQGPHEVAISPDGKFAIVTNYGYGCVESKAGKSLTVVNLHDYSTMNIPLGKFRSPHGIVAFKDNIHVAVTVECSKALLIVNIHTGEISQAIDTGADVSHMVILSADEKTAFVSNISSGSVSVLDLTTGKLIKTIITGKGAEGIALSTDGRQVWVTNRGVNTISIIEVESLTVSKTLKTEEFPI